MPKAKSSALVDTRVVYCGDNPDQLRKLPPACVDLIYIDPPFNSNRNYEVFWGETKEKRAFEDRHGTATRMSFSTCSGGTTASNLSRRSCLYTNCLCHPAAVPHKDNCACRGKTTARLMTSKANGFSACQAGTAFFTCHVTKKTRLHKDNF